MGWLGAVLQDSVEYLVNSQLKSAMKSSVKSSLYAIQDRWKKQVQSSPISKNISFPVNVVYPSDGEGFAGIVEMRVVLPTDPLPAVGAPIAHVPSPSDFIQTSGGSWKLLMGNQPNGITPLGVSQANSKLNRAARRNQAKNPGLQRIVNGYSQSKKQTFDPMKWMNKAIQKVQDVENMSKYAQSTFEKNLMDQLNGMFHKE